MNKMPIVPQLGYLISWLIGTIFYHISSKLVPIEKQKYSHLYPESMCLVSQSLTETAANDFYSVPTTNYLRIGYHWVAFNVDYENEEGSEWQTLIISIADSNRGVVTKNNGEKYGLLSSNRVPDFCSYLVHKIPKFRDAEVIVQYLDTPQQADGHSCGVFTIICCWAMSVYGTTDVLLKNKITSQISVIKLHLKRLVSAILNKTECDYSIFIY